MSAIACYADELYKRWTDLKPRIGRWYDEKSSFVPYETVQQIVDIIEKESSDLRQKLRETNAKQLVVNGIQHKIRQNLIRNFQVSNISDLRTRNKTTPSKISIEKIGEFELGNNDSVLFNTEQKGLRNLQYHSDYSRVIYLESPVYWKLKSALSELEKTLNTPPLHFSMRRFPNVSKRMRLTGVPGYFYDLAKALKTEYSGDIAFPELYEKLISKEVIGGKVAISEIGELQFQENNNSFSLHLTAMGVVNLGILALLIERKTIDSGAFLFVDEPEAHLHPSWQIKIAKTLFELAKSGVNVVIATHSADILKFLEVETKNHPENEELVALNHFSSDGVRNYENKFNLKLAKIQEELTNPFAKLYLEGL